MELELRRWTNTVGAAADTARRAARPCPRQGACRLVRGCHRDRVGRGAALSPSAYRHVSPLPGAVQAAARIAWLSTAAALATHTTRTFTVVGSEAPTMFKRKQHRSSIGHL